MNSPSKRTLFDAYLMVDWSAASVPKTGKDSIWYCLLEQGTVTALENPPTRAQATAEIEGILVRLVADGRSVLVGFDFPYAYPAGLRAALGLREDTPAWRAIWEEWVRLFTDDERNRNDRYAVAADLNRRLSGGQGPGPFWGCPESQIVESCLGMKKPRESRLPEWRLTDELAKGVQPVWKLSYAGSVGSQALLGIPPLEYLLRHPKLAKASRVWPFECNEEVKGALLRREVQVLHAEIYPSLRKTEPEAGEVKDRAQVRGLAQYFADRDARGTLAGLLDVPLRLTGEDRRRVLEEEGWMLGVEHRGGKLW